MRKLLFLFALISPAAMAAQVTVEGVRVWDGPERTRIVFDLSRPVEHSVFALENPDRIVVDLENAKASNFQWPAAEGLIGDIRSAPRNRNDLRVVFDLTGHAKPRSFLVQPHEHYGHRLVLDLEPADEAAASKLAPVKQVADAQPVGRDLIIAIDAGHGGKDPGARGPSGTLEKDIALAVAKELARQINAQPGMRAVMIRDGDEYLYLSERRERARKAKADLFISIHADAFSDARARGASVYAVSERGASSQAAQILAERENAADLVGGVSLADKDDLLASVLVDLSKTATMSASLSVGKHVIREIGDVTQVHKSHVQQAGFVVLKSPDMPSILVETAFISNPSEERKLKDRNHQRRMASAIVDGVKDYFYENPPPGTLVALWQGRGEGGTRMHVASRGETLSGIARQYKVSLQTLRKVNGKNDDSLQVGEKLYIPLGS